jgi:putative spermidine/putrescine transport system substrate-binding protein
MVDTSNWGRANIGGRRFSVVFACQLALAVSSAHALLASSVQAAEITFAGYGGAYQDALSKAVLQPVAKELGISIHEDTTAGLVDIRAQVQSNAVEWDIAETTIDQCARGQNEGLFEPLDYKVIDKSGIPADVAQASYISNNFYSDVLAWNKAKFGTDPPKTWADFWNVKKYAGRRSLRSDPAEVLEIALMADGVTPDKVYPLDIDRAFASLEKIKPYISTWWTSGAQSQQLVTDGEVDLIGIWNGRISTAMHGGANWDFTFDQGVLVPECFVIPKGAPHKDLAMKAIALSVSPQIVANLPKYIDYGPSNAKAYENGLISPQVAATLNTFPQNAAKQVQLRGAWWADNGAKVQERWSNFMNQ